MLSPIHGVEPLTRPERAKNAAFDVQRRENNLRHDREALADERARLGEERRALARERAEWEEERARRADQQHVDAERHIEAESLAEDLVRDVHVANPQIMAARIHQAAQKARGLSDEPPTGIAAEIVRQGRICRGEAVADAPVMPTNPTARAVVLVAARRRGEGLSDGDARWLDAYLQRLDQRGR